MAVAGEIANLIVNLKLDDSGFSGKLNNVGRALGRMDTGLSRMGRGAGQLGGGLARLGTVAAAAAAGGLTAVVTTAISFEDAFAGVRKTVQASDEELDVLMETFRTMARTIPVSFEELAAIGEQAGALGIATSAIDEFTEVVALLGETTDLTTDQAATSLGVLANVLHLREEDFDNFGSALVDLGNKGASTESQILAIAERAGAGASLIDIAADATLGWASSAANLGIEVEAGGSALQKFFLGSLQNIQDDDTLQVMAETAGTTADAFKQAFEKDASGALATFIDGLGDLDQASQLDVLKNLGFDDIRIQRLLLGLAGDADMLAESLSIANAAWEDNTALQTEAAKRFETTKSKLDLLIGNLRDMAFVIGNEIIPIVADLSTDFVNFLNEPGTQGKIQDFAKDLAGGIRDLFKELKGTDFSGIISGMQLAATVAKGAFDAFRALPAPIQQLAIAALIANKVSGGAVGQIAKGLVNIGLGGLTGGIAGIFGGRGGSPLKPLFVTSVGGVGGGAPAAAGGGALATAAKFILGPAAAVIIGAEIAAVINEKVIGQAKREEEAKVEAIISSDSISDINAAIQTISDQQNSDDILAQTALIASNIPFIGDALGHVGPKLDEQRQALEARLKELQAAGNNASSIASGWSARQMSAYAQVGAEQSAKIAATNSTLTEGFRDSKAAVLQGTEREVAVVTSASSAANAWSAKQLAAAASLLGEQRNVTAATKATADRIAAADAKADSRAAAAHGLLGGILAKPSSFAATINLNNSVTVNANKVMSAVTRTLISSGKVQNIPL